MEADNTPSQNPAARHTQPGMPPRPTSSLGRRPMVDGFSVRRPATPMGGPQHIGTRIPINGQLSTVPAPQPITQPRPISVQSSPSALAPQSITQTRPMTPRPLQPTVTPQTTPAPTPFQTARPAAVPTPTSTQPTPAASGIDDIPDDLLSTSSKAKQPKEPNTTGHAGLVGLVAFILIGALFLVPLLPGKILDDFPLSSQSFSSGEESLACVGTQGQTTSKTVYNTKAGTPLNYSYSTTTTISATCDGKNQTAIAGHTSQLSPLALIADAAIALVIAIIIANIWRFIFGRQLQRR